MSRFFSNKYQNLTPYTPGEQPKDMQYIKLNTNESPFPPAPRAVELAAKAAEKLQLYSDPQCRDLHAIFEDVFGFSREEVLFTNGSDEILNFAFMAFCDKDHPVVFPNITYGFYPVFAELNGIPYEEIPLCEDFTINVEDYIGIGKNIFIANPNAPTGIALPLSDIERIVASNPDNIVVIDEAYVDFGGESAAPLTRKYNNLIVTQTFSKSRSMAGARLGFGVGNPSLIADLNTIKYSTNPYNINTLTQIAGTAMVADDAYYRANCKQIMENRAYTVSALEALGFTVLPSAANFVFAKSDRIDGKALYLALKDKGVLVRHFDKARIADFNRITVGDHAEMQTLIARIKEILNEV